MIKIKDKRLFISITTGIFLGIFCVIGIGLRLGFDDNSVFLASAWFNRLIMGILIGLSGHIIFSKKYNTLIRGIFFGSLTSFAWFLSTAFRDPLGFVAGIIYGIIIDHIATRFEGNER